MSSPCPRVGARQPPPHPQTLLSRCLSASPFLFLFQKAPPSEPACTARPVPPPWGAPGPQCGHPIPATPSPALRDPVPSPLASRLGWGQGPALVAGGHRGGALPWDPQLGTGGGSRWGPSSGGGDGAGGTGWARRRHLSCGRGTGGTATLRGGADGAGTRVWGEWCGFFFFFPFIYKISVRSPLPGSASRAPMGRGGSASPVGGSHPAQPG